MALDLTEPLVDDQPPTAPATGSAPERPRRKVWKVVLVAVAAIVTLAVVAGLVVLLGREDAEQLSDDQALTEFRERAGGSAAAADGLPTAGVYAGAATGTESIGIPGFDEQLGPNSPVTVTHSEGCFSYRVDFNSHHWRAWNFCPTATATFGLSTIDSWTARKAPGLDIATLTTFECGTPLDMVWADAAVGDTRTGACTGTSDKDDSVTEDAAVVEVVELGTLTVDGREIDVVHVRTTERFSRDQTGSEVDDWWLDAETGLPLELMIESSLSGAAGTYAERATLELSTLTPET